MAMRCLLIFLVLAVRGVSCGQTTPVARTGVTDLLADPDCTVGYQLDGGTPHVLGRRWTGYDADSGVYFVPEEREDGRRQVFMHCPWVKGTGVAFADFRLRLPKTVPLRLELSTALRPTANSDGVSYRAYVNGRRLWEAFGAWKTWRDFTVDLAPYAGQEVTLRLEVDPGPARSPRDDWSQWGRAEIVAGTEAQVRAARAEQARRLASQRRADFLAAARLAGADLTPFSRGNVRTPRPSCAGPVANRLRTINGTFAFSYRAGEETVEYLLDARKPFPEGLAVLANGRPLTPAPFEGGAKLAAGRAALPYASAGVTCRLLSAKREGQRLSCRYAYRAPGQKAEAVLIACFRAEGRSLVVTLGGEPGRFAGFTVNARGGSAIPAVFAACAPSVLHRQGVYLSAHADLWQSNASVVSGGDTTYTPLTDGTRRPLRETLYLTVSRRYEETIPNIPNPPSPFLDDLSRRVVLDGWGGSFAENARWLREMARYRGDHFLMIKHVWQRDGYDQTYPDVMPASAALGGDDGLRELARTAERLGHRFCVHENFYDFYPNAEDFRLEDCALAPDGQRIPGWDNGKVRAVALKPAKLMDYALRFSPEVKRRYGPNAAYHDIMPTWITDFDARVPDSGMIRRTNEITRQLCDYDRRLYGGPVVFEAANAALAGLYDGGCNENLNMGRTPLLVAHELLKTHPKMSNHGIGYYERWLPWGYGPGWYDYVMTDRELDRYRAMEVAFGRTGFIGQQMMRNPHGAAREYHLMQAFARAYTGRPLKHLAYWVESDGFQGWIDAATAARYGRWQRLRAVYEGGQTVYVNLSEKPWTVVGRILPPAGALTVGPRAQAFTAVINGQIVDYAKYPTSPNPLLRKEGAMSARPFILYADARSHQWLPPEPPAPVTPRLAEWRDNGDGTLTLSLRWKAMRKLDRDFTIFWHFREGSLIRFQSDHAPGTPSSQWLVGEEISDGPITLRIIPDQPADEYDLVAGLYDTKGRAPLAWGLDEMKVATLRVTRQAGKVVKAVLTPVAAAPRPGALREPYLAGANRQKKMVDFGDVATDGAVIVGGREIIPVPLGEPMRVGLQGAFRAAAAYDAEGRVMARVPARVENGKTWFSLPRGAYRLIFQQSKGLPPMTEQEPVTLKTAHLAFRLHPADGSYEIEDKEGGVTWRSNPVRKRFGEVVFKQNSVTERADLAACSIERKGQELTATLHPAAAEPGLALRVFLRALEDGKTLEFAWDADPGLNVESVRLLDDALWTTDAEQGAALIPCRMGMYVPADSGLAFSQTFDTSEYQGCHMTMWGILKGGATALLTWRDPYVAAELRSILSVPEGMAGRQTLSTSLTLRRTARSFRLRLCGKGDMVTIANAYREEAKAKGYLVTWDEKLKGCPDRAKLFGAINFKLWSCLIRWMDIDSKKEERKELNWTFEEAAQVAEHLKNDLKLDRVLFTLGGWINRGYDNQHPDVLPAAPECGGDAALADCARRVMGLGYLFCLHDNYQDLYRDSPSWNEDLLMKRPDGSVAAGGHWAGGRAYLICSRKGLELANRPQNLPTVRRLTQANSYFIDTTYAAGLQECYDPNHPLTRADDLYWKQSLSDYARDIFGVFGSECGREWAIPHSDFFEGLTGVSGRYYHVGNNEPDLNERLGAVVIPLFEAVYRDSIALYGKYGYDFTKAAAYVLHHISIGRPLNYHNIPAHLYWKSADGAKFAEAPPTAPGAPDPAVFTRAYSGWAEGMHVTDRFVKNTYEILSPLYALTAQMRVTQFEFLTPDRAARRTVFGQGKGAVDVVVNFGPKPYIHFSKEGGEVTLPPYGFVIESPSFIAFHTLNWNGLRYDAPALFTITRQGSGEARVFHAFGDSRININGQTVTVEKEKMVAAR